MMLNESSGDTLATISGDQGEDGFRRVDPPASEHKILQPKVRSAEKSIHRGDPEASAPKPPISEERKRQLLERLGEPIPASTRPDAVDFSLIRSGDALQLLCPPGYSTTEGPLQRRIQARVLVRVGQDGETKRIISITIPSLTGPSREKILFPEPNPAVEAGLAALLNPPEKKGLDGMRYVVKSRLRNILVPALLSTGLALALAGDAGKPVAMAGPDVPLPTPSGENANAPLEAANRDDTGEEVTVEKTQQNQPEQPESDGSNEPVILTLEQGSSRWEMVRDYLSDSFGLTGDALSNATALLVRMERSESDVDDQEALREQAGAVITLPSEKDIKLIIDGLQGNGPQAVTEAIKPIVNPDSLPHDFTVEGDDAAEAEKLKSILADLDDSGDVDSATSSQSSQNIPGL